MNSMTAERFEIRHIPEAAKIERLCFSEPWSETALRYLCTSEHTFGVAVLENGRLAAYGGMEHVLDTGSITNVAVHPDFRRCGFAREVLSRLEDRAAELGVKNIFLDVRESNLPAKTLYLSSGYVKVGERRGYYRCPRENADVMMKVISLPDPTEEKE